MGKVLSLKEMVARYIHPGDTLHLAGGIGCPSVAVCELIRQFDGKDPRFIIIQSTITGHSLNLVSRKLARKLIFAAAADISTSGRPSRIIQQAWSDTGIEKENWSLCSLQQRLMAGALGIGFIPTRSVGGSSIADNAGFGQVADPFTGKPTGVLKALRPDVSIVHGVAADEYGNTITAVPYGEDLWGPLAARSVLVTVEKIVPAGVIKQHAALVKIPGHVVAAVCEAPYGLHPFSLANPGVAGIQDYETDTDFLVGLHNAFADEERLNAWVHAWVLDCPDHRAYLNKLGEDRLKGLHYKSNTKAVTDDEGASRLPRRPEGTPRNDVPDWTSEEAVLVAAAREIIGSVKRSDCRTLLVGAGNRAPAVLLAYHVLREQGHRLDIVTGNGQYGYEPMPGALGTQSIATAYGSSMLTDTVTALGIIVGGADNHTLSVLGAGQIDKYGNTNSTLASNGKFLVGSGGANDSVNAREVIFIINQGKEKFAAELPFVTSPGTNVRTVISNLGVWKKEPGRAELTLAGCLPDRGMPDLQDRITRIKENTGWEVSIAGEMEDIAPPTSEELTLLRKLT